MKHLKRKVGKTSTITIFGKKYSLPARFRGEEVVVTSLARDSYLLELTQYCRIVASKYSEIYIDDFDGIKYEDEIEGVLYKAALIGPWTNGLVKYAIKSKKHFLLAYPTISGIFYLAEKYGIDPVESGSTYTLEVSKPSYYLLKRYLERNASRF